MQFSKGPALNNAVLCNLGPMSQKYQIKENRAPNSF